MNIKRNSNSLQLLSQEIKSLQSKCVEACFNINNNPRFEIQNRTPDNVTENTTLYMEGLKKKIEESQTPIQTDENLITSQFLSELKEKTRHVQELAAYTKGLTADVNSENRRLKELIEIADKAKPKTTSEKEVKPEHVHKAKKHFKLMKTELNGLIQSMFPDTGDDMMNILGYLMRTQLDETLDDYISITDETTEVIELLLDMNIAKRNPYNSTEVKLAF